MADLPIAHQTAAQAAAQARHGQMLASRLFSFLFACLILLMLQQTDADAGQKGAFSPRWLLREYLTASQMLGRCPEIAQNKDVAGKRDKLVAFSGLFRQALVARTRSLRPSLDDAAAKAEIEDWLSNEIFELTHVQSNAEFCGKTSAEEVVMAIELLSHPTITQSLKSYAEQKVSGLGKVPFESRDDIQTFALPEFQSIALDVIKDNHFPQGCEDVRIEGARTGAHNMGGKGDVAPFEIATLRVTEEWDVSCEDANKSFSVTFERDAENSFGRSILPLN